MAKKNNVLLVCSLVILAFSVTNASAASKKSNRTATSMYMNTDEKIIPYAESLDGDLYDAMGHHGPAVENNWVAYRIYFNKFIIKFVE